MTWNSNVFSVVIISGGSPPGSGLFVYSPAPGTGNLIYSIAATSGTDAYGNPVEAGATSYISGDTGPAIQVSGAQLILRKSVAPLVTAGDLQYVGPSGANYMLLSVNPNAVNGLVIGNTSHGGIFMIVPPSADTSGATDLANITAAWAIADYVWLTAGTFYCNGPLQPPSGATLAGCGVDVTIINNLDNADHGIKATNLSNLTFRDFTLAGPGDVAGTNDGIHLAATGAINNITMDSIKVRLFGNDGIFANDIITSSLRNVEAQQVAEHGIVLQNGTSVSLEGCYVNNQSGFGYFLNGMSYTSLNGCACDFGQYGYFFEGCFSISAQGCGCESQTIGGWKLDGGGPYTLTGCENFKNPGIAFLATASTTSTVFSGCIERTPAGGATASFQVDAGSEATIIEPQFTTAMTLNGTGTVLQSGHVSVYGTAPGIAAGAVTSGTATLGAGATDTAGTATFTNVTGTAGTLGTITFATSYVNTPVVVVTPVAATAGAAEVYATLVSSSGFTINMAGTAGAGSTVIASYHVIGQKS